MVRTWSLLCFPNWDAKWDLESLCLCFLCEKITEPPLHVSGGFMFLSQVPLWVVPLLVLLPWGLQGSVTWCFPLYSEILNLMPSQDHDEARLPLYLPSTSHVLRARFIPKNLLLDITVCYQLRMWGGMKAASPPTPLQVPALQGSSSFQLKKKKKQRKGQGNKGKGFFLLGTVGAVHEQGLFQSISFALEVDLRWSEIIFQIKAMFQKKKTLKNQTHRQSAKLYNLKIQRSQIQLTILACSCSQMDEGKRREQD